MQGLGVEIHWGLSGRDPWVHVEAQYLGVVQVEGVLRVGWQRVCWLPVLHRVQLLLAETETWLHRCCRADSLRCTHIHSSRKNPPRQKTREGRPQCMHENVQAQALSQDGCMVMPLSHGTLGLPHYTW